MAIEGEALDDEIYTFMTPDNFEEEDDFCQVCTAIRLLPRCGKPVSPGLPTRPKICRICLVYVVANCDRSDGL